MVYEKEWDDETNRDWEEKMAEPLKPIKPTPEELEELKKEGRI